MADWPYRPAESLSPQPQQLQHNIINTDACGVVQWDAEDGDTRERGGEVRPVTADFDIRLWESLSLT